MELGEEIVIANRGIPIAKLVPFRTSLDRRSSLGHARGMFTLPDDFNTPLPEDILADFEGGQEDMILISADPTFNRYEVSLLWFNDLLSLFVAQPLITFH